MENTEKGLLRYIWEVVYAHTIAYTIAGILAMSILNYEELWATEILSSFYLPIDSPIVSLAMILQIPRGILIALFILPLRKAFFEEKYGLWKLGLIVFGFSLISTIGAPWASYESYIYTKFPLNIQIMGYPESIIYIGLFIGILYLTKRFSHKKIVTVCAIIMMVLICFSSIFSYITVKGSLSTDGLY